jgi:tRNA nucleotidyltransferase (CCA-adding enzyme)
MQTIEHAKSIIKKLNDNNYEAYLVGGCVRDYLLDISPSDFDITTNATPDMIEDIFDKSIPTGKIYGTISVVIDKELYEVTTYRLETKYVNNRRPESVKYSKILKEDLMRRDFTVNALAMDIDGNIIDYYGGINDLNNRIIRCVGDPSDRFDEDNLRKLRAIRFAVQKEFEIDYDTFRIIKDNPSLNGVSMERIQSEFSKILLAKRASYGIRLLLGSNLLKQIIPELLPCVGFDQNNINHCYDVFEHLCATLDNIEAKIELRLAALLHDIGKVAAYTIDEKGVGHFIAHDKISVEIADEMLSRLAYSNKIKKNVLDLILFHMRRPVLSEKAVRRFIYKVKQENIEAIAELFRADSLASSPLIWVENLKYLDELDKIIKKIINEEQALSMKDLAINGHDILERYNTNNIRGKSIGIILEHLLSLVIDDPSLNNKDQLIKEMDVFIKENIYDFK